MRILGLDVGGAHVKAALLRSRGKLPRRMVYPFEIWKNPGGLTSLLRSIRDEQKPDAVVLTMTGELSDVFKSRADGTRHIVKCAVDAMAPVSVRVIDVDGQMVGPGEAIKKHWRVASANWSATARWVSKHLPRCLIVDIGSTTTDILPVKNGSPMVRGKTDLQRLVTGELLYTGCLRTPVGAVVATLKINDAPVAVCPEYFSVMGDAHLYLGQIRAKDYTIPTPDNGPKTKRGAALRLARVVLSSPKELGGGEIESIAKQVVEAQIDTICWAVKRVIKDHNLSDAPVVLIGPGRIYLKRLSAKLKNKFVATVGGHPVERIDPAACCATLLGDVM
ncbi:MAG: hypothetical protein HQK86_10825 [Nitrospinae bacterium]|nr:hypothetical protein [Nitrospinota bacterium]